MKYPSPWLFAISALLLWGCTKESAPEEAPPTEEVEGVRAEGHLIRLTPQAAAAAQLRTAKAELRPLSVGLKAPARVEFTQDGVARVAARVSGRVSSFKTTYGTRVKRGAVLAYLESPELARTRADFLAAQTRARVAQGNFRREKELLEKGITSERDMRQAEAESAAAQADMNAAEGHLHAFGLTDAEIQALKANEHYSSKFPVRAPIEGTVVEIDASLGQTVEPSTPLFTVGDLSQLWVVLDIYEGQLPLVQVGQHVWVTATGVPNRRFEGRIAHVGDVVDEKTRAVQVRVTVPNPEGLLKPGMFAEAEVESTSGETVDAGGEGPPPRIIVPRQALQKLGEDFFVFSPEGENTFRASRVRVGRTSATEAEILSGLPAGATVVTHGAFILKSDLSKESLGEDE